MPRSNGPSVDDDRTVRTYEAGDAERFRSLYEAVWDTPKRPEWFDWRFEANPNADDVTMIVAEEGDELVGVEPLVPYRLRTGDRTLDAYQPADWIVHPDHRREGVFTDMTEFLLERAAEDAALLFNFPNEQLRPGVERFGWEIVETVASRYRIHDAKAALAAGKAEGSRLGSGALASAGTPILRGSLEALDRVGSTPGDVTVERVDGVPVDTVHELYREHVPDRLHVPRERSYLEWRFANPRWDTTTYVARRESEPLVSAVVAVESIDGTRLARVLDVQPMTDTQGDPAAFEAILGSIVADHADADVLKMPTGRYPEVCRRYGFFRGDGFPFSRVSSTTYHAVRPLDGGIDAHVAGDTAAREGGHVAADGVAWNAGVSGDPDGAAEGTIADGSGMAPDAERKSGPADSGATLTLESAADGVTIDVTDPENWLLALADRDVA